MISQSLRYQGDVKVRPGLLHLDLAKTRLCQIPEMLSDFTKTVEATLEKTANTLEQLKMKPCAANTVEVVADKGYFSKSIINNLGMMHWKTRISEPEHEYWYSWNGDREGRKAVYANSAKLQSKVGKAAMRKRGELVERSFQHVLDRGGQRRTQMRGLENVQKKYLLAVAGFNLGCCCAKFWG